MQKYSLEVNIIEMLRPPELRVEPMIFGFSILSAAPRNTWQLILD